MSEKNYDSLYYALINMEHELSIDQRPYRLAFSKLLGKCAAAVFSMELIDNGNLKLGNDYDEKCIMKCISDSDRMDETIERAECLISELEHLIELSNKS